MSENQLVNPKYSKGIDYDGNYQDHILEQYKIYVETTNHVTSWRLNTNIFFLSLNSLIITVLCVLFENGYKLSNKYFILFPLIFLLILSFAWYRLLNSFKQLNSAKFKVIEELEELLPVRPFVRREWNNYLNKNSNPAKFTGYKLLSYSEKAIPLIFMCGYLVGATLFLIFS